MKQHKIKMLVVGLLVSVTFLGYFIWTLFKFDGTLNVNSATVEELALLPGFDDQRAETAIAKRSAGPFETIEAFAQATGLDADAFAETKRHITLTGPSTRDRVIYKMGSTFREARWGWLWLGLLIHLFSFVLRAWRWQVLLKPVKRVGFWQSFNPVMVGFTCNTVLPLRAGEFARPALFAAKEGVSFSAAFATVVLERLFDMLAVVAVLGIAVTFVQEPGPAAPSTETAVAAPGPSSADASQENQEATTSAAVAFAKLKKYGKVIGPLALVVIVVFFVVGAQPQTAERILKTCTSFFPAALQERVIGIFDRFIVGLQSLESKRDVGWLLFWTALTWFDIILVYYTVALSFNISISLLGACLCFVLAAAAVAAPQAPGFIGPFQVAVQFGVAMLQVDASAAASYAIMLWVVSMVPTVLVGLVCMALGGISFQDVTQDGEKEGDEEGEEDETNEGGEEDGEGEDEEEGGEREEG